ncbi:hypothetical protein RRG08_042936 [Elysia crispata]|uniref:Uncharacterized protein n=1 Tax=Elysia crispata TaxID=231223 RepID=A0AAE1AUD4_9GAST|nr:hypothetical protein RRG08_042936 [Elysia crispata]
METSTAFFIFQKINDSGNVRPQERTRWLFFEKVFNNFGIFRPFTVAMEGRELWKWVVETTSKRMSVYCKQIHRLNQTCYSVARMSSLYLYSFSCLIVSSSSTLTWRHMKSPMLRPRRAKK